MPQALLALMEAERTYEGPPPVAALRTTTLRIGVGDSVSLMGRSGSGKSTLLNLMGLLDRPTSGRVLFADVDTSGLADRKISALRASSIGFVFQAFNLIPQRTATENVVLGLLYQPVPRTERRRLALQALDRVGLTHRSEAFPGQLSGGERQRVAIARAIAGFPALLLCDEPTGNLDAANSAAVLDLLDSLRGDGIAVVVVTHDHDVAARSRRHLIMTDGQLNEESPQTVQPTAKG
jgi:putative ABC transport system ATP-binding protein